MSITHWQRNS